jgi:hypothetical protein
MLLLLLRYAAANFDLKAIIKDRGKRPHNENNGQRYTTGHNKKQKKNN